MDEAGGYRMRGRGGSDCACGSELRARASPLTCAPTRGKMVGFGANTGHDRLWLATLLFAGNCLGMAGYVVRGC